MEQTSLIGVEFSVPTSNDTVEQCHLCEFICSTKEHLVFHLVESHPDQCSTEISEEYANLSLKESDQLFIYHLKICSLIMLTLMGLAYIYAFVLAG